MEGINSKDLIIQKAINQIWDILNFLEVDGKEKIPLEVKKFFEKYYDGNIDYNKINPDIPLKEQNLDDYTIQILTYLVTRYLKQKLT